MNTKGEVQKKAQEKDGEVQEEVQSTIEEVQSQVQNNKKSTNKSTVPSTKTDGRSTENSTRKPIDLRLNSEIKKLLIQEANSQKITQYLSDLVLKKQYISIECFEKISTILSTNPKKNARIQIKLDSKIKTQLKEEADLKDLTLTDYIFQIVLHNAKEKRTNNSTNASTSYNENLHASSMERLNIENRKLDAKVEKLQKDHKLLLKLIKIFYREGPNTEEDDLTEEDIELIKKHAEEALKNA